MHCATKKPHLILLKSVLRYERIMSFHKAVALSPLFTLHDVLNAFCQCSGPSELPSYPLHPFVNVKRYTYMLIVCILQSLKFIHD